jgi:hypothetical protein
VEDGPASLDEIFVAYADGGPGDGNAGLSAVS